MRPPVGDVDRADAADHQFQFPLVERPEQGRRYQFRESLLQRQELLLDASHEPVVHVQLDVLPLVLLGDEDLGAARLQFVDLDHAEAVVLDGERRFEDAFGAVLATN